MPPPFHQYEKSITGKVLTCHCDGICPETGQDDSTCKTRPGGSCFSSISEVIDVEDVSYEMEPERIYGCMATSDDGGLFSVKIECVNSYLYVTFNLNKYL